MSLSREYRRTGAAQLRPLLRRFVADPYSTFAGILAADIIGCATWSSS